MSNVGEFPLSSFLEDRTQKLEIRRRLSSPSIKRKIIRPVQTPNFSADEPNHISIKFGVWINLLGTPVSI